MPGANCSIYNCSTSRRHSGLGIFKLPAPKDEFNKKWREQLLNIVIRDRVVDAVLQKQIDKDSVHICERHFSPDQLYICKLTSKLYFFFVLLFKIHELVYVVGSVEGKLEKHTHGSSFYDFRFVICLLLI